ncbi:hypothetical protein [Sneathiella aquimaris]|uniref:hypothetical protein n=1 Tax=Sneathiella aquimaris TaxID=2599305 RepID=UPI00146A5ABB|nr:hypothetical protein [Sneathiella aquimaris]
MPDVTLIYDTVLLKVYINKLAPYARERDPEDFGPSISNSEMKKAYNELRSRPNGTFSDICEKVLKKIDTGYPEKKSDRVIF